MTRPRLSATARVTVPGANTVDSAFDILCRPVQRLAYAATAGGGKPQTIVRGIAILFPRLVAGDHTLGLGDVAESCAALGGTLLVVTVPPRDTVDVELVLHCPDPSTGAIRVGTYVRAFDLDPDGVRSARG